MLSSFEVSNTRIQKLRGPQDYPVWKHQVKYLLIGADLWKMVEQPMAKPEFTSGDTAAQEKWEERNNRALAAIMMNVTMEVAVGLDKMETANEV